MVYHLYSAEFRTFVSVIVLAAVVLAVELLYFEREIIATEIEEFESAVVLHDESLPPNTE